MVLRLNEKLSIDNLRNYAPETVEQLRALLAAGVPAHPDPHRENFYELEDGPRAFYIHVPPRGNRVLLLAAWLRNEAGDKACDRAAD